MREFFRLRPPRLSVVRMTVGTITSAFLLYIAIASKNVVKDTLSAWENTEWLVNAVAHNWVKILLGVFGCALFLAVWIPWGWLRRRFFATTPSAPEANRSGPLVKPSELGKQLWDLFPDRVKLDVLAGGSPTAPVEDPEMPPARPSLSIKFDRLDESCLQKTDVATMVRVRVSLTPNSEGTKNVKVLLAKIEPLEVANKSVMATRLAELQGAPLMAKHDDCEPVKHEFSINPGENLYFKVAKQITDPAHQSWASDKFFICHALRVRPRMASDTERNITGKGKYVRSPDDSVPIMAYDLTITATGENVSPCIATFRLTPDAAGQMAFGAMPAGWMDPAAVEKRVDAMRRVQKAADNAARIAREMRQPIALPKITQVQAPTIGDGVKSNPIVCADVHVKHRDESRRFCVQMQKALAARDAIKTIHSVKELSTRDLELGEFAIAGAKDRDFAPGVEPKKAVFFRVGAGIPDREYTIEVKVGTNKGDIIVSQCRIRVVA
jgi:hypothetical protein